MLLGNGFIFYILKKEFILKYLKYLLVILIIIKFCSFSKYGFNL